MPRPPKDFEIEQLITLPHETSGRVQTGPGTAVPTLFTAQVALKQPELTVWMDVRVDQAGTRPRLVGLRINSDPRGAITTSVLRHVLIDQLLRAALEKASEPATDLSHVQPYAFRTEADAPNTAWVSAPPRPSGRGRATPDELAREASRTYRAALTRGSRAPVIAVANEMGYSRAQVARYIRRARQLGLLPPVGGSRDGGQRRTTSTGNQKI